MNQEQFLLKLMEALALRGQKLVTFTLQSIFTPEPARCFFTLEILFLPLDTPISDRINVMRYLANNLDQLLETVKQSFTPVTVDKPHAITDSILRVEK